MFPYTYTGHLSNLYLMVRLVEREGREEGREREEEQANREDLQTGKRYKNWRNLAQKGII